MMWMAYFLRSIKAAQYGLPQKYITLPNVPANLLQAVHRTGSELKIKGD